jgi:glutamine synthetase
MDKDMIQAYIDIKRADVELLNSTTHPVEFDMYYSV